MKFIFEPDDIDILHGIVEESTEHLNGIEEGILKLETDFQPELLDSVFRAMHSVKGVASFVDFVPIRETAHGLESFLTDMKKGLYAPNCEITDVLLRGVDIINLLIQQLAAHLVEIENNPPKEAFEMSIDDCKFQEFVGELEALRSMMIAEEETKSSAVNPAVASSPPDPSNPAIRLPLEISPLLEQMLQEFIEETCEHLETIEQQCMEMEKHADKPETINNILRSFHSIKGGAGVISSMQDGEDEHNPILAIKSLTHASESLLQIYSKQGLKSSSELIDIILEVLDKLTILIRMVKEDNRDDLFVEKLLERVNLMICSTQNVQTIETQTSPVIKKLPQQFSAFMNITNQAMDSMLSIINTRQENKPVNRKRLKQYQRALKNIHSSAKYLDYDLLTAHIEKSIAYMEKIIPEEDMVDRELVNFLQQDCAQIQELLNRKLQSINALLEEVPVEYSEKKIGEILVAEQKVSHEDIEKALGKQKKIGDILIDNGLLKKVDMDIALAQQSMAREKSREMVDQARIPASESATQSIRVSQEKLDRLMNMIGELLISKNRIFHLSNKISLDYEMPALSREVKAVAADLGRISDELQDAIMSARMVPLRVLFQRYPRTIRDTAKKTGKIVDLIIEGEDTELDKTVIEAINDPLVHMLRNAVDHAIELPEIRRQLGKNPNGTIRLKAYYQGSHAVIEISDDGKGLNPEELKLKALKKGLIRAEQIETLSNEEAMHLIFAPGFSTRDEVSELSGRGVGMDVVRTNVEEVGGTVNLHSVVNEGTTFTLKIPLSMSIIKGLMVECRQQCFIIPLDAIEETVKLPRERIRSYKKNRVADIRGEILPLLELRELLQIKTQGLTNTDTASELVSVVIINVDGMKYGLIVDRFQKEQEFVVKALADELAELKIYTGATIMGDGSVVLILNAAQLSQLQMAAENRGN